MTHADDEGTDQRVSGVRAADSGDASHGAQEEQKNAQEETLFACPYCRRAYSLGAIHEAIAETRATQIAAKDAEEWLRQKTREGQPGSEKKDGATT